MKSKNKKTKKSAIIANKSKQMTLNFQDTDEVQFIIAGFGKVIIDWGDGSLDETQILSSDHGYTESCWHLFPDKSDYTVIINGENIKYFECSKLKLVSFDVCKNSTLTNLKLVNCNITRLDLSNNKALEKLRCYGNQITCLDVSKNTALTWLDCNRNHLTSLDVSKNSVLTNLNCSENYLTCLDMKKNNVLELLYCDENQLSTEALNNLFRTLPFVKKGELYIDKNPGTEACDINIAKSKGWKMLNTMTMNVHGSGEVIIQMAGYDWINIAWGDIRGYMFGFLSDDFVEYSHIYTEDTDHSITIIGENITHLYCGNNSISALDVSKNPALEELGCYENQITHLDVSKNTELKKLECWSNQLTTLDVSNNTLLTELNCRNNPLKNLNVGNNDTLKIIR